MLSDEEKKEFWQLLKRIGNNLWSGRKVNETKEKWRFSEIISKGNEKPNDLELRLLRDILSKIKRVLAAAKDKS